MQHQDTAKKAPKTEMAKAEKASEKPTVIAASKPASASAKEAPDHRRLATQAAEPAPGTA